jgi:hypothetical protein
MRIAVAAVGLWVFMNGNLAGAGADEFSPYDVEQAARRFRIQVYDTFREERDEFDRRSEQGAELWRKWEAAGRPSALAEELTAWYEAARRASRADARAELPAWPDVDFARTAQSAEISELPQPSQPPASTEPSSAAIEETPETAVPVPSEADATEPVIEIPADQPASSSDRGNADKRFGRRSR